MSLIEKAIRRIEKNSVGERTVDKAPVLGKVREHSIELNGPVAGRENVAPGGLSTTAETATLRKIIHVDRSSLREAGLFAPEDEERKIIDEYRQIKRPLIAHAFGQRATQIHDGQLILVTSALAGEGKTFTCINLALSLAREQDRSVLLVDADVVKPHISKLFGVKEELGLLDLLVVENTLSHRDLILPTDVPRLSILPAGQMKYDATELLAGNRMESLMRALSDEDPNRIVLFDSAPLLLTSETHVLAGLVGQIVLIVHAGQTPQHAVLEAISSFDENKAVNLVLNQVRKSPGAGYYGGYRGYGSEPEEPKHA
ncbi:MAG: P-loop NTPase [Proteobacteria bacterium]|nr:P-loop NTPase [Pseudomonadota bacterium]